MESSALLTPDYFRLFINWYHSSVLTNSPCTCSLARPRWISWFLFRILEAFFCLLWLSSRILRQSKHNRSDHRIVDFNFRSMWYCFGLEGLIQPSGTQIWFNIDVENQRVDAENIFFFLICTSTLLLLVLFLLFFYLSILPLIVEL